MTEGGGSVGVVMPVNLEPAVDSLHRFSDGEFPRASYVILSADLRTMT
jgi:hypothetical protein